jgi:carbon-monoxide dehydrogenase iron sulfur subunit
MNGKLIVFDPKRCTGCRSCEVVCSTWNEGETNPDKSRIRIIPFAKDRFYCQIVCQQCTDPMCMEICPTNAIYRNETSGAIKINRDDCVGCKLCLQPCPSGGMLFFNGFAAKCELCDGAPKCVEVCEWNALTYDIPEKIGKDKRSYFANLARKSVKGEWIDWWE